MAAEESVSAKMEWLHDHKSDKTCQRWDPRWSQEANVSGQNIDSMLRPHIRVSDEKRDEEKLVRAKSDKFRNSMHLEQCNYLTATRPPLLIERKIDSRLVSEIMKILQCITRCIIIIGAATHPEIK
jgi:hypothetical protein